MFKCERPDTRIAYKDEFPKEKESKHPLSELFNKKQTTLKIGDTEISKRMI